MVLNTLVVDIESETLLNKERKPKSLRGLVAGAAAASFLLGLVAATAVSTSMTAAPTSMSAAPPAASPPLHAKKDKKKLGSSKVTASYTVNIACLDEKYKQKWNSLDSPGNYDYTSNYYFKPEGAYDDWGVGSDFNYIETAEYALDFDWAANCPSFGISILGPDGEAAAPTYRVYDQSGVYYGPFQSGDNIKSSSIPFAVIPNLDKNLKGDIPFNNLPYALKSSVFLESPDGTVQSNRYLLVDITFKPKSWTKAKGHQCVIEDDVTSDGFSINGEIKGCDILPPSYYCESPEKGISLLPTLRNVADGQPIDIEFKNFATLEIPLTTMQVDYKLNYDDQNCKDLCSWAQGKKKDLTDAMLTCWVFPSYSDISIGPMKIHGQGRVAPRGFWDAVDNGDNWVGFYPDYAGRFAADNGGVGYAASDSLKNNEVFLLSGLLTLNQWDDKKGNLKKADYGLEVHGISFGYTTPRGDGSIVHNSKFSGAYLKDVNLFSWWGKSDGPNLNAQYSKMDTSFIMSADDVMHISASHYYAWKNVVISGSAGSVVMLGSYNALDRKGTEKFTIKDVVIDGLFIPMAKKTRDSANNCDEVPSLDKNKASSCFGHRTGIIGTISCMNFGPLDLSAKVKDVVVAGLGPDENGDQIIQLNRLYSIMADSYETYQYVCGAPELTYEPASQLPAPKFNLELGPFYLSGNGVYDASNECNWVNNGKGDWNIKFDNSGEDLKGALANPACPY